MNKNIVFIAVLILLIGGGGYYWWSSSHSDKNQANGMAGHMGGPTSVSTFEVKQNTISVSYELPGRVTPYKQSQVRPQVAGIITERLFEEGTNV